MPSLFAPFAMARIITTPRRVASNTQLIFTIEAKDINGLAEKPVNFNRLLIGYPEGATTSILNPDTADEVVDFGDGVPDFDDGVPDHLKELMGKPDPVAIYATFAYLSTVYDCDLSIAGWVGRFNVRDPIIKLYTTDMEIFYRVDKFQRKSAEFDGKDAAIKKLAQDFFRELFSELAVDGRDSKRTTPERATFRINMLSSFGQSEPW